MASIRRKSSDEEALNGEPNVDNKRSLVDVKESKNKRQRGSLSETDDEAANKPSARQKVESKSMEPTRRAVKLKTSTLYISGLHPRVTRLHLEKMMQKYGSIKRLSEKRTPTTYYAFCEFASIESAQRAMESLDGVPLLERRLIVKAAHEQSLTSQASHQLQKKSGTVASQRQQLEDKIALLKRKIKESESTH